MWFLLLFRKHMWCLLCRTSTFFFVLCCKYTMCADGWGIAMWFMDCHYPLPSLREVNDFYVWFIAHSIPPLAAYNNFSWEVSRLYTWQEAGSRLQEFGSRNLTKQRVGLSGWLFLSLHSSTYISSDCRRAWLALYIMWLTGMLDLVLGPGSWYGVIFPRREMHTQP